MHPRRYAFCLLLLAAGLLSGSRTQAQVHELPTRFYLLPRTQHRYDSARHQQITLRCWLLRYTERRYAEDAGTGTWYVERKDRAAWFFGRVTRQVQYRRQVQYNQDHTKYRMYRYRRNFSQEQGRPTWTAGEEFLVAERKYQEDGALSYVRQYRARYYKIKQRPPEGKMPKFHRRNYRTMPRC